MLYTLAGTFYCARDILKFDSLGGELSADLGKSRGRDPAGRHETDAQRRRAHPSSGWCVREGGQIEEKRSSVEDLFDPNTFIEPFYILRGDFLLLQTV